MKNLWIIALISLYVISCTKLTDKNIRGNWEIESYKVNGADSSAQAPSYFAFNDNSEAVYFEDYGSSIGTLNFNYSLDEKAQILTFLNLYGDTTGFVPIPFTVDKSGKRMTLTYSTTGLTLIYELKQVILDY